MGAREPPKPYSEDKEWRSKLRAQDARHPQPAKPSSKPGRRKSEQAKSHEEWRESLHVNGTYDPKAAGDMARAALNLPTGSREKKAKPVRHNHVVGYLNDEEALAMGAILFHNLDSDRDGYLTMAELTQAREAMLRTQLLVDGTEGKSANAFDLRDNISMLWDSMDADQNGHVDHEEWDDFLRSLYEIAGPTRFLNMAGGWATTIQRPFALPRPSGPGLGHKPEDRLLSVLADGGDSDEAEHAEHLVMGRYLMDMSDSGVICEHAWCTTHSGKDTQNGQCVAVKIFKSGAEHSRHAAVARANFEKQLDILMKLQEPFGAPTISELEWVS